MDRMLVSAAAVISLFALAGCRDSAGQYKPSDIFYADQGRPDAAWKLEKKVHKLGHTDLDFENAAVGEVVLGLQEKFNCTVRVTKQAQKFIEENDLRVTARVGEIPENLAFAVLRAQLEANGLVLVDLKTIFGQPGFELDRSAVREAQAATSAAK
jgi:hypothetical protein